MIDMTHTEQLVKAIYDWVQPLEEKSIAIDDFLVTKDGDKYQISFRVATLDSLGVGRA